MTREGYLKHKELIEAWANGVEIERLLQHSPKTWVSEREPEWHENATYRIKKKPLEKWLVLHKIDGSMFTMRNSKEEAELVAKYHNSGDWVKPLNLYVVHMKETADE